MAKGKRMTVDEYKFAIISSLLPYMRRELRKVSEFLKTYFETVRSETISKEQKEICFDQCDNYQSVCGRMYSAPEYERFCNREIERLEAESAPTEGKYFNCHMYSDINPYACVNEISPNKVEVVRMICKPVAGSEMGDQNWIYEMPEYTDADKITLTRRKNGLFYEEGQSMKSSPFVVSLHPYHYYDWSF